MHWTNVASLLGGWLLALPIGVLASECSRPASPLAGSPMATQSTTVLATQTTAGGTVATLSRATHVDNDGGNPTPHTALQWQRSMDAPWLRLEWPGHAADAQMNLQEDGTVTAQLHGLQVRIRPAPVPNDP